MKNILTKTKEIFMQGKSVSGSKGYNLARLDLLDMAKVPCFYAIKSSFLSNYTKDLVIDLSLDLKELSQSIQSKIEGSDLSNAILSELAELNLDADKFYSVRSSAGSEDGVENSFAGIFESYLFQKGNNSLAKAANDCLKSAYSYRALDYHKNKNLNYDNFKFSIIIQEMIDSDSSGVLFTINPENGVRSEAFISSNWGLGEGVVSGECDCDDFSYSVLENKIIKKNIKLKEQAYYFDKKTQLGSVLSDVKKSKAKKPCLDDKEIAKLARLGKELSDQFNDHLDIEWCIKDSVIYLLQARPITSVKAPTYYGGEEVVFDNSNIQESFCGVTTPLTFSYANEAYFQVYHQLLEVVGLKKSELKKHERRHNNMISLINGRVFYNIRSWYDGLLLFPSFNRNKEDMEKMMGLEHPVQFVEDKNLNFIQKIKALPLMFKCYSKLIMSFIKIDKLVYNFSLGFYKQYNKFNRKDFKNLNLVELQRLNYDIVDSITSLWQAPIINDFYVMTMNGKVLKWLTKAKIENPESVLGQLVMGEEGIESLEPTRRLMLLAQEAKENDFLKKCILERDANEIMLTLIKDFPTFYEGIQKYIQDYGDRCIGELKLESSSLTEDPSFLFSMLRNFIKSTPREINHLAMKEEVLELVKKKLSMADYPKFKKDLKNLIKGTKNRENMRLMRTKVFGLSRQIYREMGKQMAFYEVLESGEDIFFLTMDEIERYIEGRSLLINLAGLIKLRKEEFNSFKDKEPDNHFKTLGPVYLNNDFKHNIGSDIESSIKLKGLGCYPGIVKKKVRLVFSPEDNMDINGDILCTLRTDPGWAPLFPTVSGLIVERGSILSHSAIIAREFGIPTIVGIPNITKILTDGEEVTLNGESGEVIRSSDKV
jgi:phosphoenolpyruvate synthase/pyruvate phosphate dikinase